MENNIKTAEFKVPEIVKALWKVQTNIKAFVEKNGKNAGFGSSKGYNYFTESDLLAVIKKEFEKNNIMYLFSKNGNENIEFNGKMYTVTFSGTLELTSVIDNSSKIVNVLFSGTNTDSAKAIGSALTYGVRYWLAKITGIPTDELDPDKNENSFNPKKTEQKNMDHTNKIQTHGQESVNNSYRQKLFDEIKAFKNPKAVTGYISKYYPNETPNTNLLTENDLQTILQKLKDKN